MRRSEEDVPGYLIPDIYRQYYLSGVVTDMLVRVFYHNLIDITSMPLLAARLGQLYQAAGLEERLNLLHPAEHASLARAYVDLGWIAAGEQAYHAALAAAAADAQRAQLYRDLGLLLKRRARREEAVALWEEWIGAVPGEDVAPYVELAKHHEWHTADLAAARGWTAWAVRIAEGWPPGYAREATLLELRHRLARASSGSWQGRRLTSRRRIDSAWRSLYNRWSITLRETYIHASRTDKSARRVDPHPAAFSPIRAAFS